VSRDMWQAIEDNTRRSRWLILLIGLVGILLGALVGWVILGSGGALWGLVGALVIWGALLTITFRGGERVLLFASGAREIRREDAPRLWNVVEEMTIAAALEPPPRVYLLDGYMQNAFSFGFGSGSARIVVTEGLVRRLTRDELQGVIAHEIGHIRNQDVRFMTLASVMLGGVTLIADTCRRILCLGGGRRSRAQGLQVWVVLMVLLGLCSVLAPVFAHLLYLACARRREFLADASAARFTRYPEGLASALEKISERKGVTSEESLRVLAPMYVVNPLGSNSEGWGWFRTHPPTELRIRILRSMAGAGWADYERAWHEVRDPGERGIDPALLASEASIPKRPPSERDEDGAEDFGRSGEVVAVFDRDQDRVLVECACGLRIKVPASFPRDWIHCPRCGSAHRVPQPGPDVRSMGGDGGLVYRRRSRGWETFRCECGRVNHLSPGLRVSEVRCRGCRRHIRIVSFRGDPHQEPMEPLRTGAPMARQSGALKDQSVAKQ